MSKRGGVSEVNGFVSIGSDSKKTTKKNDGSTSKKETEDYLRRRTDTNKDTTPGRSRVTDATRKKESSSKLVSEKKEIKPKDVSGKNESSLTKKVGRKESIKKEVPSSLNKTSKTYLSSENHRISSKEVQKSRSDVLPKPKETALSPYVASKGTKPKTVQSTPQLKKHSIVANQSKDSPYRSSVAQNSQSRTNLNASGDRPRKTSQLKENPLKVKASSSSSITSRTNKQTEIGSTLRKKSVVPTSSKLKSQRDGFKKTVTSISEESDTESQRQLRPFGEIPRSNTFTKEEGGPESLTSDLSVSQSLEPGMHSSSKQVDLDDEYNYDDDFEDYESDFEEYLESGGTSSTTEEEEDSSETDSFDEDKMGDGYKGNASTSTNEIIDSSPAKTTLNEDSSTSVSKNMSSKENQSDKEKSSHVEEERKLDSGSYDLTSHADLKRRKQIQDIRAAIDRENASLSAKSRQRARTVAEDEGFVEIFSQETSPTFIDASYSPTEGLINFENARKQQINEKAKAKVKKRGALLMEMIKLDVMSFNLLDIPSVPYEVYMKCYGRSDTLQIYTQTNEDAVSEEVQTEDISVTTKWTQHPVKYTSANSPDDLLFTFSQEKLGVGGESTVKDKEDWFPKLHVNSLKLHNFINNAGEMILTLLEECERDRNIKVSSTTNKRDFGFSESYFSLNVARVEFLKNRPVSFVCFSESNSSRILTVHKPSTEQPLTIQAESEGRCVLCTWSVREPSCPLQTMVASNNVSSVCYHSYLVLAGLIDGVICLWDLREQAAVHARCYLKEPEWLLRSPTYITADLEKEKRHSSSIVSIKILPESNPDDSVKTTSDKTPTQMITLDEDGLVAVWTIVESRSIVNINSGLAPWGKVRLIQSSQLKTLKAFPKSQQSSVQCRCLAVDSLKPSNLYVGTNMGQVLHSLQTSTRARPQFYISDTGGNTNITCMEFSRCEYPLLMVGDSSGRMRMYRTVTERPLLDLSASSVTPGPAVKCLQWSPTQPGLFFVLDSNSCIHVWDLCTSDMYPKMSVPFTSHVITSISLTPHPDSKMLAVASEKGTVDVYNLKDEFGVLPRKTSDEQHNIFNRYITIL